MASKLSITQSCIEEGVLHAVTSQIGQKLIMSLLCQCTESIFFVRDTNRRLMGQMIFIPFCNGEDVVDAYM